MFIRFENNLGCKKLSDIVANYFNVSFKRGELLRISSRIDCTMILVSLNGIVEPFSIDELMTNEESVFSLTLDELVVMSDEFSQNCHTGDLTIKLDTNSFKLEIRIFQFDNEISVTQIDAFTSDEVERAVLIGIANGKKQTELAAENNISQSTVSNIRKRYLEFLQGNLNELLRKIPSKINFSVDEEGN